MPYEKLNFHAHSLALNLGNDFMYVTRVLPSQDRDKLELLQFWVTELTTVCRLRDQDATDQGSTRRWETGLHGGLSPPWWSGAVLSPSRRECGLSEVSSRRERPPKALGLRVIALILCQRKSLGRHPMATERKESRYIFIGLSIMMFFAVCYKMQRTDGQRDF